MKTFLIITAFSIIFTNCSHQSAFSYFNITPEQAKSEESIQSSEIYNKQNISGVVSAIYLNSIMPKEYNGDEYFYIYMYSKNDDKNITFLLNNKKALKIIELQNQNKFSHLVSSNPQWKKYYLVKFSKEGNLLKFQVKLSQSSSKKMIYIKN
jgi:hypothetical protein